MQNTAEQFAEVTKFAATGPVSTEISLGNDLNLKNQDTFDSFDSSNKAQPSFNKLSKLRGEYIVTNPVISGLDTLDNAIGDDEKNAQSPRDLFERTEAFLRGYQQRQRHTQMANNKLPISPKRHKRLQKTRYKGITSHDGLESAVADSHGNTVSNKRLSLPPKFS